MKLFSKTTLILFLNLLLGTKIYSQGTCASPYNMGTIGTGSTCTSFAAPGTTGSSPCAGAGYGGSGGVTYVRFCTGASLQCINFSILQGTASGNWAVTVYSANCTTAMDAQCLGNSGTGATFNTASPAYNPYQPNSCYIARIWNANSGSFSICAQAMTPPNDLCAGATPIGPAVLPSNNFCMTALSPGDPGPAAFCAGSLENNAWYTFTTSLSCVAPCTVVVTISNIICSGGGAGFQIGYFTGTCGSLTNIGCTSGSGGTVTATITGLTPGQVVTIGLDGNAGANCTYGISASNTVVLPIELMNFILTKNVGYVGLNWSTATETNNDYYTVEKTIDGKIFETVAVIDGGGNSTSTINYRYNDVKPYYGISYYRLKQTDYDKSYTYSEMRAVEYKNDIKLNFDIVPNPSSGGFNLSFNSVSEEEYVVEITDLSSKIIYSNTTKLTNDKLTIDNGFAVGMYMLTVRNVKTNLSIGTKKLLISE